MLYFDDLEKGQNFELGSVTISKDEIQRFAREFDPQIFHLDESVATPVYGGLVASGWHSASLMNRLAVEGFMSRASCMASPGIEKLSFVRPVLAGDTLNGALKVIDLIDLKSKTDMGLVKLHAQLSNQEDNEVLSMIGNVIIRKKKRLPLH